MSRETDERPDAPFEVMWPYSLDEFKKSSIGLVAMRAIKERADEIVHAADTGEPPLGAMLPAFHIPIDESHDWRMIERMIHEWLGPSYVRAGRKRVPLSVYRKGLCYTRVS